MPECKIHAMARETHVPECEQHKRTGMAAAGSGEAGEHSGRARGGAKVTGKAISNFEKIRSKHPTRSSEMAENNA